MNTDANKEFKPTDYVEALRAKIRTALVEIIPDEQWDKLIRLEIAYFFNEKEINPYYYHARPELTSGFKETVRSILAGLVKERVQDYLNSPEWSEQWKPTLGGGGNTMLMSEGVSSVLRKYGLEIMQEWLGQGMQQILISMRNSRQ